MFDFLHPLFEYRFLSNAALACLLAGVIGGLVGTYIVCRRLVFLAGGITHASFGGIGIAWFAGIDPLLGAALFAVLSAVGLEALSGRWKIREDSAIGILWSAGMAVGILFIALTPGYTPNLMSFLFGNILAVTRGDLAVMGVLAAVLVAAFTVFYRPILYTAFDKEYARTQKIPVGWIDGAMMALAALAIVGLIRLVGIVLLISLLTIPPVIVGTMSRSFRTMLVWSCPAAAAAALIGLFISYHTDIPSGASTILVLCAGLGISKIAKRLRVKL